MHNKKIYWTCTAVLLMLIAMIVGIQSCTAEKNPEIIQTETVFVTESEATESQRPSETEEPTETEENQTTMESAIPTVKPEPTEPSYVERETTPKQTEPAETVPVTEEPEETEAPTQEATEPEPPVPTPTADIGTPPLPTEETEPVTEPEVTEADETIYATANVNIRTGPGTEYEKIGMLKYGSSVRRTGIAGDWSRILWKDQTCYIHSNFVSTEKPDPVYDDFPIRYGDGSVNITIYKEWYCDTWCYAAHVQLSDYARMSTRCANGGYGNGYQTTTGAAYAANAILAVNGDYSAPKLNYIVVRNGTIWNGADRNMWMPGVYSAHTGRLLSAWETGGTPGIAGVNVQELVDAGTVTDTFCFGPPLLQGGAVQFEGDSRAQRTFIGTNGNAGDIWMVVSDGRYNDGASAGLTAGECARFLISKGCSFGIPLDGGGSSTMVFNGQVLNGAKGNQRSVVDFLVVTK